MKLTPKQARFIDEYMIDLNGTQAAIRAGYSKKTAFVIATENLKKPYLAHEIKKRLDERAASTGITAEKVLQDLRDLHMKCVGLMPVTKSIIKDGVAVEVTTIEFEPHAANGALTLIGKHLKMFTDKVEHTGKDGVPLTAVINITGKQETKQ